MPDSDQDDFFADADAEPRPALIRDVNSNGAGLPAARTAPPARGAVSSLREALTGAHQSPASAASGTLIVSPPRRSPVERALDSEPGDGELVRRPPRPIRRGEVHHQAPTLLQRGCTWVSDLLVSPAERAERLEDARLERLVGASRSNLVALVGPRGGGGKTTSARTVGGIAASTRRVSAVLVDADQHYGPAADLVRDSQRSSKTIMDLIADFDGQAPPPPPELRPYLSRFDDGLLLLAAPTKRADMKKLAEDLSYYERALRLLSGLDLVLFDTAGGIGEVQEWALRRADQAVVLCPPDYVAANNIAKVLSDDELQLPERTILVLNDTRPEGGGDLAAIERHFARHNFQERIRIPYDHKLRLTLDQATYSLAALPRKTRLPLKRLAATVGEGLK